MPLKSKFCDFRRWIAPEKQWVSGPSNMLVDKLNTSELAKLTSNYDSPADGNDGFHTDLPDHQLEKTHALPTAAPNVTHFTYPSGSKPLARYTIRRGIGMGGFGEVYFAVSDAGKEVALKRIQRNLEVELRGVSHCLNLKHPNLVSLHDICQSGGEENAPLDADQWWVVMEYIAGPNLRQVLDDSPTGLSEPEVRRWFTGMASGVSHLHDAGLVHRDLKPGNIFDDSGIVKVGDYGLSKFISSSHRGGHTESVGTFHYMAPEIGRGQYGREIDIYALGIVLFELLTGRVPFDGESCHEIIVKHLTAIPDLSGIASPYRETIAKCLEKDPQNRFANVDEMLRHLNFEDASVSSTQPQPTQSAIKPEPVYVARLSQAGFPGHAAAPVTHAAGSAVSSSIDAGTPEPLARAVRNSFDDLKSWWRTLDRSPGAKALLFTAAIIVFAINTHWLLPMLSLLGIVYVPYYIVRQMVLHVSQQPSYAQAQRIAGAQPAFHPRVPTRSLDKKQWRHNMRSGLRAKHSVHRLAELNTSWVAATFTVAMLGLIAGVVGLRTGPLDAMSIAPFGLVATVVLFTAVCLLGMGKLWERDEGEGLTRRLALAGVGAAVGAVTFAMTDFLMLPIDQGLIRDVDVSTLPQTIYNPAGEPSVTAMMAHFAMLFAALRWWKPVDPLRRTRLSLWSVAVAVVAEWAVHQVLPIPQPMGMMIAGGTAIVIQMSATWINPKTANSQFRYSGAGLAGPTPIHGQVPIKGSAVTGIPVNQVIDPQSYRRGAV
jgi:serine/threonine protein kinase